MEFLADIYRNIDASILVRIGEPGCILNFTIDTFNLFFRDGNVIDHFRIFLKNILFT